MIYGILLSIYIITAVLLVVIILLQQGKGGLGLGMVSSSAQMIFGGSGGQDVFQKTTWILGAIFMSGSLMLALMKAKNLHESEIVPQRRAPITQAPIAPATPVSAPAEAPAQAPETAPSKQ